MAARGSADRGRKLEQGDPSAASSLPERCQLLCELPVRLYHTPEAGGRRAARRLRRRLSRGGRGGWRTDRGCVRDAVQADHVSGLPALVEQTGAIAYLPAGVGVSFEHVALANGEVVEFGNTLVTAIETPGHAPAHNAYAVADRRRGSEQPWLLFSGDSLLIGDVGRPDLHVADDAQGQARLLHASLQRLLQLPDYVVLYPSHYGGSVCGRGLSSNPVSSIGFERTHNPLLALADPDEFASALVEDMPRRPVEQEQIIAANRTGTHTVRP